jgi:hypothetical protein
VVWGGGGDFAVSYPRIRDNEFGQDMIIVAILCGLMTLMKMREMQLTNDGGSCQSGKYNVDVRDMRGGVCRSQNTKIRRRGSVNSSIAIPPIML